MKSSLLSISNKSITINETINQYNYPHNNDDDGYLQEQQRHGIDDNPLNFLNVERNITSRKRRRSRIFSLTSTFLVLGSIPLFIMFTCRKTVPCQLVTYVSSLNIVSKQQLYPKVIKRSSNGFTTTHYGTTGRTGSTGSKSILFALPMTTSYDNILLRNRVDVRINESIRKTNQLQSLSFLKTVANKNLNAVNFHRQKSVKTFLLSSSSSSSSTTNDNVHDTGNGISGKKQKQKASISTDDAIGGIPFPRNSTSTSGGTERTKKSKNSAGSNGVPRRQPKQSNNTIVSAVTVPTDASNINNNNNNFNNQTDSSSQSESNNDNDGNGSAFDANSVLAIEPRHIQIVEVEQDSIIIESKTTDAFLVGGATGSYRNGASTSTGTSTTDSASSTTQSKPLSVYNSPFGTKNANGVQSLPFVDMFRGSANYIANHRNTIAVYHIPGGIVDPEFGTSTTTTTPTNGTMENSVFRDLMNDIALTWLLGMKIVIVAGCRHQIEKRTNTPYNPFGVRVTDEATLRLIKEESGLVRFEVERQLARSLRLQGAMNTPGGAIAPAPLFGGGGIAGTSNGGNGQSMSLPVNSRAPMSNNNGSNGPTSSTTSQLGAFDGNVVSGIFYSAQPFGILDGVDYKYTGFVRRVEVEKIRRLHEQRDICLLTSLGVSPSGEVFSVNSECLAASVAGALGASKVIYFTEQEIELRHSLHGNKINSLRNFDARNLLSYNNMKTYAKGYVVNTAAAATATATAPPQPETTVASSSVNGSHNDNIDAPSETSTATNDETSALQTSVYGGKVQLDVLLKIGWCTEAVALGVKRAHIISPKHGALLQELYTRDGSGTLICADLYEGIRRADPENVSGIRELISPLIRAGTLIDRPVAQLEKDIDTYYVYTRDQTIVACGQLKKFENNYAEIGCLVVNKEFRSLGRGDAMLGYLERLCLKNNCNKIFVLSTQTMEWFIERGFKISSVIDLPPSRQATYNYKRNSKIYLKIIENDRDLDASELWWNR